MEQENKKAQPASANSRYFVFHASLIGYKCFLDGKEVAKSTLFWMQERSINISKRLSRVKVTKR